MGRPIKKKFFGDQSNPGGQLNVSAWFNGEAGAEASLVIKQESTNKYSVEGKSSGKIQTCKLVQGAPAAEGEAQILVTPFTGPLATATATGSETAGVVDSIIITDGGSGYATIPVVTVGGDGSSATAEAVLTAGVVTGINITNGGSGYTTVTVTIAAPSAGTESVNKITTNKVRTFEGGLYLWSELAADEIGEGDLDLS